MDERFQLLLIAAVGLGIAVFVLSLSAAGPPASNTGTPVASAADGSNALAEVLQKAALMQEVTLVDFGPAPELTGLGQWFNSPPLTLASLKGKVVLVDFWTYSCINCLRTLPYLQQWHEKYADKGLVILGLHAPEFDFEKKPENVQAALAQHGITYPVAQDNDHATWNAFENQWWPHKYLIDKEGVIRYHHIGEGGYEETETVIQSLLGAEPVPMARPASAQDVDFDRVGTPELYLGSDRFSAGVGELVGFQGNWKQNPDNMELMDDLGIVRLVFQAKSVNIVAEAGTDTPNGARLTVMLGGKPHGTIEVTGPRLYPVAVADAYGPHGLEFGVTGKGFKLYTFTFG